MQLEQLAEFCKETGLHFWIGECGFGRPCVGVMDLKMCYWLGYEDCEAARTAAPPEAYGKGEYVCVEVEEENYAVAVKQLENWIGQIRSSGCRVVRKTDDHSMVAAMKGPQQVPELIDVK